MPSLNSPQVKVALLLLTTPLLTAALYSQPRGTKPPTTIAKKPNLPLAQFSISTTCSVPIEGKLRERKVPSRVVAAQTRALGNRTPMLNEVIRQTPHYFPPQACVLNVTDDGDRFLISLNQAFSNARFWRTRTWQSTKLAFHALARNVAFIDESKGIPLSVQFVIEGRKVTRIGSFQVHRALLPGQIMPVSR